jgi:hypothetical protein
LLWEVEPLRRGGTLRWVRASPPVRGMARSAAKEVSICPTGLNFYSCEGRTAAAAAQLASHRKVVENLFMSQYLGRTGA